MIGLLTSRNSGAAKSALGRGVEVLEVTDIRDEIRFGVPGAVSLVQCPRRRGDDLRNPGRPLVRLGDERALTSVVERQGGIVVDAVVDGEGLSAGAHGPGHAGIVDPQYKRPREAPRQAADTPGRQEHVDGVREAVRVPAGQEVERFARPYPWPRHYG